MFRSIGASAVKTQGRQALLLEIKSAHLEGPTWGRMATGDAAHGVYPDRGVLREPLSLANRAQW